MVLNEERYLAQRIDGWRRLEELTNRGRSLSKLSGEEIVEFVRLYRRAAGDLAYLVTHSSNRDVVIYLNALTANAYGLLYRHRTERFTRLIEQGLYIAADTVRRRFGYILVAAAVFFLGTFYAAAMLKARPDLRHYFIDPMMEENFDAWKSGQHDPRSSSESFAATGMYASNNPRVGIMTVGIAAGTAGIGSTYMMWKNGEILGALGKEMHDVGQLPFLIGSILPHGVSEIGGIFVAGGIGFLLAAALLFPGRRTLADSFRRAGRDGFVLIVVALVMIFAAAPIEGFFSFNPDIPLSLKYLFGLGALLFWGTYFGLYGRNIDPASIGLKAESEQLSEQAPG